MPDPVCGKKRVKDEGEIKELVNVHGGRERTRGEGKRRKRGTYEKQRERKKW